MGFEDTFKKQIDQIGKVLIWLMTGLLGLKELGKINQGEDLVRQTFDSTLKIDYNRLLSIDPGELVRYLQDDLKFSNDNMDRVAGIFYELAGGMEEGDKPRSKEYYERSLTLYEFLNKSDIIYSFERHYRIKDIRAALAGDDLD